MIPIPIPEITDIDTDTDTDTDKDKIPMRYQSGEARSEFFVDYLLAPPGETKMFHTTSAVLAGHRPLHIDSGPYFGTFGVPGVPAARDQLW